MTKPKIANKCHICHYWPCVCGSMAAIYGGPPRSREMAPSPTQPITQPIVGIALPEGVLPKPRKATITARVDEDGKLCVLFSIDGKKIAESSCDGDAVNISMTVEIP